MRPQKVLDSEMLTNLTEVFRKKGYDGASLAELAEATGLKKASLYHRFPGGKQEMAETVLAHLDKWVEEHIFSVLLDESLAPEQRLVSGLNRINGFYDFGGQTCIFRAFSMQSGLQLFERQIHSGMNAWIAVFTQLGVALNMSTDVAKENAVNTLIAIQGGLIVAKSLNDMSVFDKMIKKIETQYLL